MDRDWKMITIPNWDFIRQTIEHFNLKISGLDVDQYFSNDVKIELLREIHHKQTVFRVIKGPEKTGVIRKPYDDFAENWFRDTVDLDNETDDYLVAKHSQGQDLLPKKCDSDNAFVSQRFKPLNPPKRERVVAILEQRQPPLTEEVEDEIEVVCEQPPLQQYSISSSPSPPSSPPLLHAQSSSNLSPPLRAHSSPPVPPLLHAQSSSNSSFHYYSVIFQKKGLFGHLKSKF